MKLLKVCTNMWITYIIGTLEMEIGYLIARDPKEKFLDYLYICDIFLKCFNLTTEDVRILFSTHKKIPECTWKYF